MTYCVRTDIDAVFGKTNVDAWADLDGDQDAAKITARIATAIATADDEIEARMRHGPYALPLADDADDTPILVRDISAKLAGVWLYECRGVADVDAKGKPVHRLQKHYDKAVETLQELRAGVVRIDNTSVKRSCPTVVKAETTSP